MHRVIVRSLGPYQLLRKVGAGGMAEVWSARRVNRVAGEKFVAIKILARHLAENPRYREMFIDEARLSLTLNHANIVTVFDVVEDDGECYMVMELIEGMTLSQLVRGLAKTRDEQLPTVVVVHVIAELLRALAYAHGLQTEQGSTIVHRDVSPQNVMVTTSGEVKLMDFGIARFSTEETSGNMVKGKLQYMPPEQLTRRTREPTIDLFAVGGVLQELLEGKRFRGGVDQEVLMGMVFRGEVPEPTVEIPEALDRLRRQLLEPDPERRLSSAKQALTQIYDWPGYRNASLQLEELVCEFVEPSSATSLPDAVVAEVDDIEDEDDSATVARDSAVFKNAAVGSPPAPEPALEEEHELDSQPDVGAQPDATGGNLRDEHEAETEAELPTYGAVEHELAFDDVPVRARGKSVVALAGVASIAVLALIAWRFGVFTPAPATEPASEPGQTIVAAPVVAEPAAERAAESGSQDPPVASGESQPAAAPEPPEVVEDDEIVQDDEIAAGPSSSKKATSSKVAVEFVASDFYFVYVKVGGRQLTLEPDSQVRLPVGSHTVYLRQKPTDEWKKAGSIRLSKGSSYRVEMRKPAGLRLIKQ